MMIKRLTTVLTLFTVLFLGVSTANATKPLDVDCSVLEATNTLVNDFLDKADVGFENLGQLVSTAILDEEVFDQLNSLIMMFSGSQIYFESATQVVPTNARCRLIPQLIGQVRD